MDRYNAYTQFKVQLVNNNYFFTIDTKNGRDISRPFFRYLELNYSADSAASATGAASTTSAAFLEERRVLAFFLGAASLSKFSL